MVGLSELITAVRAPQRTERYRLLAALYCLGAYSQPVSVAETRALLALHIGRGSVGNISRALRRYAGEVEIAAGGPPQLWRITAKGVTSLRQMSGLPLSVSDTVGYQTDVGIICALESPEFAAVMNAVGGAGAWTELSNPGLPHRYRAAQILTASGRTLRVIGTSSMSMGLTSAAIATTQLVLLHKPRLVVTIGIAAGTRNGRKQFGDVLVADPSVDYNSGKVVGVDGIREFLPDPYPIGINPRLRSIIQKYIANPAIFLQFAQDGKASSPRKRIGSILGR